MWRFLQTIEIKIIYVLVLLSCLHVSAGDLLVSVSIHNSHFIKHNLVNMAAVEAEIGKSKHIEDEVEKCPDDDAEDDVGTQDPEKKKKKRKKKKKAAGEVGK